jgi:hypothetical protein
VTLFTELTHAIADKTSLTPSILHIVLAGSDKQMIGINAERNITAVTGVFTLWDLYTNALEGEMCGLPTSAAPKPDTISVGYASQPNTASRIRLRDAVVFQYIS